MSKLSRSLFQRLIRALARDSSREAEKPAPIRWLSLR
jgi:hypothetical protein